MISREQLEELISADLDGALSPEEQSALEQALSESEKARALQAAFKDDRARLKALPWPKLPKTTDQTFQRRVREEKLARKSSGPHPSTSTSFWPNLLAAALFLGLGLSVYLWSHSQIRGSILYLVPDALAHRHHIEDKILALHEGPEPHLTLYSPPLYGRFTGGPTRFALRVDSGATPSAAQLRVSYDLQNSGEYDRVEVYRPFHTDDEDGWEVYTERIGHLETRGTLGDFQGGRVKVEIWLPEDHEILALRMGASRDSSFLKLPHRNLRPAEDTVAKAHQSWMLERTTACRSEHPRS